MGIILIPCIVFWFIMSIYSLRMGYLLLSNMPLFPHATIVYLIAISTLLLHVHLGLNRFKNKESLWAFQITIFFTINKITFSVFFITLLIHWLKFDFLTYNITAKNITESVIFIILFTLSLGAIIGTFKADAFIDKHKIKRTY